jgi:hypothetical protein
MRNYACGLILLLGILSLSCSSDSQSPGGDAADGTPLRDLPITNDAQDDGASLSDSLDDAVQDSDPSDVADDTPSDAPPVDQSDAVSDDAPDDRAADDARANDESGGDMTGEVSTDVTDSGGLDEPDSPVDLAEEVVFTPLNSQLSIPPSGTPCSTPGSLSECVLTEVCRPASAETGRCESCDSCGHLFDFCNSSDECDIVFTCFQNSCVGICPLGTTACGPVDDCLDIGHPTHGVCRPG